MTAKQALSAMLANLVGSRKWMFTLVVLAIGGVLVARGAMTKDEWFALVKWVAGATIVATGAEKIGSPTPATPTASLPSPAPQPVAGKDNAS